jgi:two-component system nitrate/nitrite response regulator NarL
VGEQAARGSITVVVADDHPPIRQVVATALAQSGIDVVAFAADGGQAVAAIEQHRPHVAIVDASMPLLSGVTVIERAAAVAPGTRVILYTGNASGALASEAFRAGAHGVVTKDVALDELVRAVIAVAGGGRYVDSTLALTLLRANVDELRPELSTREREILRLLARGMTNAAVAAELNLSPDTVRTYVTRAMRKLQAETRTQAVATAIRLSLID